MAAIRNFFEKRRIQARFKLAGRGQRLAEDSPPPSSSSSSSPKPSTSEQKNSEYSSEAKRAGEAALARMTQQQQSVPSMANRSQQVIRAEALKELAAERQAREAGNSSREVVHLQTSKESSTHGVYFKCPLVTEERLTKSEMQLKIREFLYEQLKDDKEVTPCYMIHTLNLKDKVSACVQTLSKYLENIIAHPDEEKYHKIRVNNRVYQDKVASVTGAREFLLAAGFDLVEQSTNDDAVVEEFYLFNKEKFDEAKRLLDILQSTEPIKAELDRDLKVFAPSPHNIARVELPPAFFNVTADDVKREQILKSAEVEKNLMLRTKAMRDRDEMREMRKYKYSLIRIRFPDGIVLQGTFTVYEKLDAIFDFVRETLINDWQPFVLTSSNGKRLVDGESTLLDLHLIPTAVVYFAWDQDVLDDLRGAGQQTDQYLNDSILNLMEELKVS